MDRNKPTLYQIEQETIREYIVEHQAWSQEVFGQGTHTEGLLRHIEKELNEVREAMNQDRSNFIPEGKIRYEILLELTDIIILTVDAMWRLGFSSDQIVSALIEKQNINKARRWPKITNEDEPTEHLKDG